MQLLLDEGGEARAHVKLRELLHGGAHLARLEQRLAVEAYLAQVVLLEREGARRGVHAPQRLGRGGKPRVALASALGRDEVAPGHGLRVGLAHGGEDRVDVALEDVVWREEPDLARVEGLALLVEEERDSLKQHGRLARAGDAVHQQHGDVLMTHDLVLLALDRGGDGLQLLGVAPLEGGEQQRVLDRHRGVEVGAQLVAHDVELPAQREVDRARLAVHLVGGPAHLLVVVGLRHGGAPVHHERATVLVGHAGGADVDVARRAPGTHLERDLREVRLHQQQHDAAELVHVEVVVLVVGVDDGVQRLDGGERLDGLVRAAKVQAHLLAHVDEVLLGAPMVALQVCRDVVAHLEQLGVELGEVRLLGFKDRVLVLHGAPSASWHGISNNQWYAIAACGYRRCVSDGSFGDECSFRQFIRDP